MSRISWTAATLVIAWTGAGAQVMDHATMDHAAAETQVTDHAAMGHSTTTVAATVATMPTELVSRPMRPWARPCASWWPTRRPIGRMPTWTPFAIIWWTWTM